jgi:hypothetical protein
MAIDNGEVELGYGMETRVQRLATFIDGVIYTAASGRLDGAGGILRELDPVSGLSKQVLLARASRDLDDGGGRLVVRFVEGSGEEFVTAGTFSFSGDGDLPLKAVAGVIFDANSSSFEDSGKGQRVSEDVMRLIIDGVATAQGCIEKNRDNYMTRNELQALIG